jgi:hypothetical protein
MVKKKKVSKESKELQNISSNKILIRIYKNFGSDTRYLKNQYEAEEKRDEYNNLISINEEQFHNEDLSFNIDTVYSEMSILLSLENLSRDDKVKELAKRITKQKRLIFLLEKYIEFNALFNFCDEMLKLKDLETLKETIEHKDSIGSYFTIENGYRVYSFVSNEGFLIPIFNGINTHTTYEDYTRKKKINYQEDRLFAEQMSQRTNERLATANIVILTAIAVGLVICCLVVMYKTWDYKQGLDDALYESAYKCSDVTSRMAEQCTKLLDNTVIQLIVEDKLNKTKEKESVGNPIQNLINNVNS